MPPPKATPSTGRSPRSPRSPRLYEPATLCAACATTNHANCQEVVDTDEQSAGAPCSCTCFLDVKRQIRQSVPYRLCHVHTGLDGRGVHRLVLCRDVKCPTHMHWYCPVNDDPTRLHPWDVNFAKPRT